MLKSLAYVLPFIIYIHTQYLRIKIHGKQLSYLHLEKHFVK